MKEWKLLQALGSVDPVYVQEAAPARRDPRPWIALAAGLCLLLGAWAWQNRTPAAPGITLREEGLVIPPMEVELSADGAADMLGFFIYQGRCYVQYELLENVHGLTGNKLGTATGLINEWTPKEGYVEYAGSVRGDFYSVRGYDPSFMLCIPRDGELVTYVNISGITLKYGADLFESALAIADYRDAVAQTRADWYIGGEEFVTLEDRETVDRFLESLNRGLWIPTDRIPLAEGERTIYDRELWHLWLRKEDGTSVHLRLYAGGYVRFAPLIGACVQMDPAAFDALIAALEN